MNDEIKEILDGFKEVLDNPTTTDECYDGRIIQVDRSYDLEQDEIKLLLDYITNLQQAIKDTKDTADDMLYELQRENERLKEENQNLLEEIHKATISSYEQGQQDWKELNKDYKSRCEKASEYIKENQEEEYVTGKPMLSYWAIDGLLNILQNGSDSE